MTAALPTINTILGKGGAVIIMFTWGAPKGP